MTDVYASHSNPNWQGIAVVEELLWYDETFGEGIDHGLTKYDKYWGPHYFYENSVDGQSVKRNLILALLAENSRYWVPLIKNINMLF